MGQGRSWWPWAKQQQRACDKLYDMVLTGVPVEQRRFENGESVLRPQLVLAINCTNVLLDGFTIGEGGPFWNVHVAYCQNAIVRRVRINAPEGPNSDGVVIDSSRNVLIEDCDIHTVDDCVSLKSGMNEDGWRVGKPTENVIVRRVRATQGHGAIAIGSDMSGGVRNVFVHDCHYDGPSVGIRLKAARGRGGTVENVFVQDITMGRIRGDAIQFTTEYPTFAKADGRAPNFRNIDIRNISCEHAKTAVRIVGLPDAPFQDIRLQNVTIAADEGLSCSACNRIELVDVRITPQRGPVMALRDGAEVLIQGLNTVESASVFLDLRGRLTRNIRLRGAGPGGGRPTVQLGIDVPTDVLVHE
jgi:polygalacturonase